MPSREWQWGIINQLGGNLNLQLLLLLLQMQYTYLSSSAKPLTTDTHTDQCRAGHTDQSVQRGFFPSILTPKTARSSLYFLVGRVLHLLSSQIQQRMENCDPSDHSWHWQIRLKEQHRTSVLEISTRTGERAWPLKARLTSKNIRNPNKTKICQEVRRNPWNLKGLSLWKILEGYCVWLLGLFTS